MNWYTIFYLMSVADNLSTFAIWIAVLSTLTFVITLILRIPNFDDNGLVSEEDDGEEEYKNWISKLNLILKHSIVYLIIFWSIYILIPSRKDMILIVAGGTVGQFISNDENAKKLPSEVFQYLRKEVLEATADLDETVANEIKKELGIKNEKEKLMELSKEELIQMLSKEKDD